MEFRLLLDLSCAVNEIGGDCINMQKPVPDWQFMCTHRAAFICVGMTAGKEMIRLGAHH